VLNDIQSSRLIGSETKIINTADATKPINPKKVYHLPHYINDAASLYFLVFLTFLFLSLYELATFISLCKNGKKSINDSIIDQYVDNLKIPSEYSLGNKTSYNLLRSPPGSLKYAS